jgi:hypothetical protein
MTGIAQEQDRAASPEPGLAWLKDGAQQYQRPFLAARLDDVVREAGDLGLSEQDTLRAIREWAARRSHAAAGYPYARSMMLDALESVLLADAAKRSVA